MKLQVPDAAQMEGLGARLAQCHAVGAIVYLCGELGAGKTTLVRGFLRGLDHTGKVRSPTYTLVEPYHFSELDVYHIDLYRLGSAEELEWLGFRDLLSETSLLLIEWPERGAGELPEADLAISITNPGEGREVELMSRTGRGERWLKDMATRQHGDRHSNTA